MKSILTMLLALWATASAANETVNVYQLTGQRQCVEGGGLSAEKAADLLRGQGVTVTGTERRTLPLDIAPRCGAPVPEANVITIAAADWAAFRVKNPDAGGYGIWVFDDPTVEVYMYDGTLQCGMGEEIPPDQMADALRAQGIEILESRKGTDGLTHIAVCGASTGAVNVFTIQREELDLARELGFRLLVSHDMAERIKRPMTRAAGDSDEVPGPTEAPGPIPLLW
jgi:hypothetical protein